jgi:hypothetical protein
VCSSILFSVKVSADPWIDTSDSYVRQCVETLAQQGIISHPVNTYPLMWKSIQSDLNSISELSDVNKYSNAVRCVKKYLFYAKKDLSGIRLSASNSPDTERSYGETWRQEEGLSIYKSAKGKNWAFKVRTNYLNHPIDKQSQSFTGSYLAGVIGNWVISVDSVDRWWGPGKDSGLILTNNALAFPAFRITRQQSDAPKSRWLSWIGKWSFTALVGQQKHNNQTPDTDIWGARLNWRPISALEIGISRVAQRGRQSIYESVGSFNSQVTYSSILNKATLANRTNLIQSQVTIGLQLKPQQGLNQLAALDLKWHLTSLINLPLSVYYETAGDKNNFDKPSALMQLAGLEYNWGSKTAIHQLYIESSGTQKYCNNTETPLCGYQNQFNTEGFRQYGVTIGSAYGDNAHATVVAYRYWSAGWQASVKIRELNFDDDLTKNNLVNQSGISSFENNDKNEVQFSLRTQLFDGKLYTQISYSEYSENGIKIPDGIDVKSYRDRDNLVFSLSWETHF